MAMSLHFLQSGWGLLVRLMNCFQHSFDRREFEAARFGEASSFGARDWSLWAGDIGRDWACICGFGLRSFGVGVMRGYVRGFWVGCYRSRCVKDKRCCTSDSLANAGIASVTKKVGKTI